MRFNGRQMLRKVATPCFSSFAMTLLFFYYGFFLFLFHVHFCYLGHPHRRSEKETRVCLWLCAERELNCRVSEEEQRKHHAVLSDTLLLATSG